MHWFIAISFQRDWQEIEGLPASGGLARRYSCPPSFLSAVFVAEWRTGGLARRLYGGLAC